MLCHSYNNLNIRVHFYNIVQAFEILNVSRVTLKVFDNNPTAHSCYESLGFVDVKYWEKVFPYKDEMWGCYDMAIEKYWTFEFEILSTINFNLKEL